MSEVLTKRLYFKAEVSWNSVEALSMSNTYSCKNSRPSLRDKTDTLIKSFDFLIYFFFYVEL